MPRGKKPATPRTRVQDSEYFWDGETIFRIMGQGGYRKIKVNYTAATSEPYYKIKYKEHHLTVPYDVMQDILNDEVQFQDLVKNKPVKEDDDDEPQLGRPVYLKDVMNSELTGVFYRKHLNLYEAIFGYADGIVGLGYYKKQSHALIVFDAALEDLKGGRFRRNDPLWYRQNLKL